MYDKTLCKNYTISYVNWDDFDKILNDYISHHNKKFDFF